MIRRSRCRRIKISRTRTRGCDKFNANPCTRTGIDVFGAYVGRRRKFRPRSRDGQDDYERAPSNEMNLNHGNRTSVSPFFFSLLRFSCVSHRLQPRTHPLFRTELLTSPSPDFILPTIVFSCCFSSLTKLAVLDGTSRPPSSSCSLIGSTSGSRPYILDIPDRGQK
jgi:hypothetical protein